MENLSFKEAVDRVTQQDKRYAPEAYFFVRDGLEHTTKNLRKGARGLARHVNGKELSEGLCNYALDEYGPLAYYTLKRWGITRTDDFGEIVFALIAAGMLGKTDEDNLGFAYSTLDRYIRTGEIDDPAVKARIDQKHRANQFKLELMQTFPYEP